MTTIQTLLSMAVCLFAGLMMTRALKRLHLPDVTAYLIAGVFIGTYCIGRFIIGGFSFGFNSDVAPVHAFTIISESGEADPAVEALIQARQDAKKAKNFAEADRIRDELKAQGIEIVDMKDGASWKRV